MKTNDKKNAKLDPKATKLIDELVEKDGKALRVKSRVKAGKPSPVHHQCCAVDC